jgi:hypothetical protein
MSASLNGVVAGGLISQNAKIDLLKRLSIFDYKMADIAPPPMAASHEIG